MAETTKSAKSKPAKRAKLADAREAAFDRAKAAVRGLESNPVGVLVGGLTVGLIAGALIPRGDREKKLLGTVGQRLAEGATAAVIAARATGKEQLSSAVLGRDAAKESARKVFDSAVTAARGIKKKAADAA
ncbi:hypothetical protein ASE86_08430 [Sphingomonas sp. Leaf33]|uniref:hypothetical protein n=1 Tax=Sphingomonas sp. Leaf33 TaxID=1736215 RepID=UPI0006F2897B|nr:hypothetical protein [Sphingomonas sp. Leaf33]KQN26167.1 hypothetical protein ASE86_08430 [Sphingomonas sp. Leaf33]